MYGSCEGAPALPEDVWLHLLGSVPPEDVVFFHGLLNTSYFHRSVFVKHILVQSGLRPSAEDVSRCCKVNPLAPADIWATLIQEKWGMRMYAGDFISSVVHATRLASTRQIFHQYVVAIPYIRFLALNHQLIDRQLIVYFLILGGPSLSGGGTVFSKLAIHLYRFCADWLRILSTISLHPRNLRINRHG
jgi:hypothetical protein